MNRELVGRWKAVRQSELVGYGAEHEYVWEYRDLNAGRTVTGRLAHTYADGAAHLASAVLAAAAAELGPAPGPAQARK